MIRLAPACFAVALFGGPLLVAPERAVAVAGLAGLLLAAAGIVAGWRWPVTAAACAFLVQFALALGQSGAPPSIVGAAASGLALFLLLQSADLARRARRATVDGAVVWSQIGHWIGLGAGTLVAALLAVTVAHGLAAALPIAATPFLAAGGALGMMVGLAAVIARAARRASREAGGPRIGAELR